MEGNTVRFSGGETYIYAYDDAVNAKTNATINGGRLWCYAANNDGIDSNGTMVLNGGLVISSGSAAPEEAFDLVIHEARGAGLAILLHKRPVLPLGHPDPLTESFLFFHDSYLSHLARACECTGGGGINGGYRG